MRLVIDTNLLVSGAISSGLPRQLLDAAKAGHFELCSREILLAELLGVLLREKFAARLAQAARTSTAIVDDLRRLALVVTPATCRAWWSPTPTTIMCWPLRWRDKQT